MVEWWKKSSSFQGKEDPKKFLSSGKLRVGKFVCMGVTVLQCTPTHAHTETTLLPMCIKFVCVCVCARVGKFKYIAPSLAFDFFSARRLRFSPHNHFSCEWCVIIIILCVYLRYGHRNQRKSASIFCVCLLIKKIIWNIKFNVQQ